MVLSAQRPSPLWQVGLVFALLAAGVGFSGRLYYLRQEERLQREVENNLAAVADLKRDQIVHWRKERLGNALFLSRNQAFARAVQASLQQGAPESGQAELLGWMRDLERAWGYRSVLLLDPELRVRLATRAEQAGSDALEQEVAARAQRSRQALLTDLHRVEGVGIHLDLVAPLLLARGAQTTVVDVLLVRLDPHDFLYRQIQTWPTPSPSAESMLVRREGDQVLFLNELRHRWGTALALRIPLARATPAALAGQGQEGMVQAGDYRGVPVVAALRRSPDSTWALVAKVDEHEVYAPIRAQVVAMNVVVGALLLAAAALVGFMWWRQGARFYRHEYQAELERRQAQEARLRHAEEIEAKNRELEAALAAAREATELKGQFLANVSHEIRTPMNAVLGMSELLLGTPLSEEQREYAAGVHRAAEVLLRMLGEILDFGMLGAGRLKLEPAPFDPAALVQGVGRALAAGAQAKGLELACEAAPGLPGKVLGDEARLRQVLLNLADNAVKFTERGSVTLRAEVQAEDAVTATIRFSVRDTGPGMDEGKVARLFLLFVQGDGTSTRRHGGTGLGLAVSKQLVKLMGGAIQVTSVPGRGSCFWFSLALVKPEAAGTEERARAAGPLGYRILLAEDNPVNQRIAQRMLERAGCRVESVSNGLLALEAATRGGYDLVLMDVQMPEMDGYEATKGIRQLEGPRRDVPIVAMTANAMQGDRERCLAAGMDDYLSKPVRGKELERVVRRWAARERGAAYVTG